MLDLKHLKWGLKCAGNNGSGGSYLKAFYDNNFYKLSSGDSIAGIYGHESVNECITSDVLSLLHIPHVLYEGDLARVVIEDKELETFTCWSKNFCAPNESKVHLDTFYELKRLQKESAIDFCKRLNLWNDIELFLLSDFIFINRDRHGANFELIKSTDEVRLAPIYDNGLSLVAPQQNREEAIVMFNPMQDCVVNNFIGSRSLFENLNLITKPIPLTAPRKVEVERIVENYSAFISHTHQLKITDIICERLDYLKKEGIIV